MQTMAEIKRKNAASGEHWFSPDTMRFFHSRVGSKVWPREDGSALFISSEQREPYPYSDSRGQIQPATPRRYTVREAKPDGSIDTVGEFMAYATRADAEAAIRGHRPTF